MPTEETSVTVCCCGSWPTGALKLMLVGLTVRAPAVPTVSPTGILIGLPVADAELIVTTPVYERGDRFAALTLTFTIVGVVPLLPEELIVAASQGTLVSVVADTVNATGPGVAVTATVCEAGAGPPAI